jgi:hypothetical protein
VHLCDHEAVHPTVLIVDDHAGFRESARELLVAEGFDVVGAWSLLVDVAALGHDCVDVSNRLLDHKVAATHARLGRRDRRSSHPVRVQQRTRRAPRPAG